MFSNSTDKLEKNEEYNKIINLINFIVSIIFLINIILIIIIIELKKINKKIFNEKMNVLFLQKKMDEIFKSSEIKYDERLNNIVNQTDSILRIYKEDYETKLNDLHETFKLFLNDLKEELIEKIKKQNVQIETNKLEIFSNDTELKYIIKKNKIFDAFLKNYSIKINGITCKLFENTYFIYSNYIDLYQIKLLKALGSNVNIICSTLNLNYDQFEKFINESTFEKFNMFLKSNSMDGLEINYGFINDNSSGKCYHIYLMHIQFGSRIFLSDSSDGTNLFKLSYEKNMSYSNNLHPDSHRICILNRF